MLLSSWWHGAQSPLGKEKDSINAIHFDFLINSDRCTHNTGITGTVQRNQRIPHVIEQIKRSLSIEFHDPKPCITAGKMTDERKPWNFNWIQSVGYGKVVRSEGDHKHCKFFNLRAFKVFLRSWLILEFYRCKGGTGRSNLYWLVGFGRCERNYESINNNLNKLFCIWNALLLFDWVIAGGLCENRLNSYPFLGICPEFEISWSCRLSFSITIYLNIGSGTKSIGLQIFTYLLHFSASAGLTSTYIE